MMPCMRRRGAPWVLSVVLAVGLADAAAAEWLLNPNDDPALGDATPNERFGEALALDGDRLAIAAPASYDPLGRLSGRVRVFRRAGAGWTTLDTVHLPGGQDFAQFGAGLAMQGNTLVVGAPGFDRPGRFSDGVVQVFEFDGARYQPRQELADASGGSLFLGNQIALDGDTLAVTRSVRFGSPDAYAGEVAVYVRVGTQWQLQQVLRSPAPLAHDAFGSALSLVGDSLIVGAIGEPFRGAAYAYARSGGQWALEQRFSVPPGEIDISFGYALAYDGQRLLIGAPSFTQSNAGAVYEYRREAGGWLIGPRRTIDGQADLRQFGVRIARHGTRWLVGAVRGTELQRPLRIELFGYLETAGELRIERQASLDYVATEGNALRSLAMDSQSMLVGLPTGRAPPWSDAGEVRVVPLSPAGGTTTVLNTGATARGELFGAALAAPPGWLLVGAPSERRRSALAGTVYAWPRNGGALAPGEPQPLPLPALPFNADFGSAVAASGPTVLVGAPALMGAGIGSVHAFEHDGSGWRMTREWRLPGVTRNLFGRRIVAQDLRVVAAAPAEDNGVGAIYVIERQGTGWAPPARVVSGDPGPAPDLVLFGTDLALDANTVAATALRIVPVDFGPNLILDGVAYVFERTLVGWTRVARLERPPGAATTAAFGSAIALRGDRLVVGAPSGGEVHVYARGAGGTWAWQQRLDGPAASAGGFGSRLRFVDDELWISAPVQASIYRYRVSGGGWRLVQRISAPSTSSSDSFATDFDVAGNAVFVGTPSRGGHQPSVVSAGAVWIDEASLFADGFEP